MQPGGLPFETVSSTTHHTGFVGNDQLDTDQCRTQGLSSRTLEYYFRFKDSCHRQRTISNVSVVTQYCFLFLYQGYGIVEHQQNSEQC